MSATFVAGRRCRADAGCFVLLLKFPGQGCLPQDSFCHTRCQFLDARFFTKQCCALRGFYGKGKQLVRLRLAICSAVFWLLTAQARKKVVSGDLQIIVSAQGRWKRGVRWGSFRRCVLAYAPCRFSETGNVQNMRASRGLQNRRKGCSWMVVVKNVPFCWPAQYSVIFCFQDLETLVLWDGRQVIVAWHLQELVWNRISCWEADVKVWLELWFFASRSGAPISCLQM